MGFYNPPTCGFTCMAETAIVTVQVDKQGRCYIPKAAREKLGFNGKAAHVTLEVQYDG